MAKKKSSAKGDQLRILFVGDVVGTPGVELCSRQLPRLRQELSLDAIVVNGENSSITGRSITAKSADALFAAGADLLTTGNHIWGAKDFYNYLDSNGKVIRPANYPPKCPGKGYAFMQVDGTEVAVMNLQGRLFMKDNLDCPFRTAESQLLYLSSRTKIIFVDFHAEATSEKEALGFYLDGKISGIVGTHTHVQTSDERVLPQGTAYISDLGCCGALNSSLGMKLDTIMEHFLTQMPVKFTVEDRPPFVLHGVWIDVDRDTGRALAIERLRIED